MAVRINRKAIVGRDFLPRGTGIVTRRPLILQLVTLTDASQVPEQVRALSGRGNSSSSRSASSSSSSLLSDDDSSQSSSSSSSQPVVEAPTEEWGEFLHCKGRYFTNFDAIRDEIQAETDRLLGRNRAVSAEPIRLKIYSPNVLTLTLIDLPGITKVPVGDQPADIEQQLGDMIRSYIASPHCIILAVTAANQDLANSDALKLAREADPYGVRTLGVLTKVDLMDHGTDALEILQGKVYPLKLGFVAVVNRSQQDINERRSIAEAVRTESAFFQRHPAYRVLAHRLGTGYLARLLNQVLMNHIKDCLPDIKNRIAAQVMEIEHELASFGDPLQSSETSQGALILDLVSKFCSNFCDAIDGRLQEVYGGMAELYGGARISHTFHSLFAQALDRIDPFDRLNDQDIRTAIRNATGPRPSLFVPEICFDLLVKRQIQRLEKPSQQCCEIVFDELLQVASQCDPPELGRFMMLREKVVETVSNLLRRKLEPTKQMISSLIQIELAYINTNHPDFIGGARAVAQLAEQGQKAHTSSAPSSSSSAISNFFTPSSAASSSSAAATSAAAMSASSAASHSHAAADLQQPQSAKKLIHQGRDMSEVDSAGFMKSLFSRFHQNGVANGAVLAVGQQGSAEIADSDDEPSVSPSSVLTAREKVETAIIKSLISSYFNIVRKTVQDVVPKTVMCLLVNASKQELQSELVRVLYREGEFGTLLKESDDVAERRAAAAAMLTTLRRAMEITNEVRDWSAVVAHAAGGHGQAAAAAVNSTPRKKLS